MSMSLPPEKQRRPWMAASWSILCLAFGLLALAQSAPCQDASTIAYGMYLARAGDCIACHSNPGDQPFAGGRAMVTPFGTLYSPNISPDRDTGIGDWTATEFYTMMHTGHTRSGEILYPAMPYAAYTKVTRADSDAIFAYLQSVPPVHQPNHEQDLRFPYNNRQLLLGWRTLYFKEGEYQPNPAQSAEWNRGAYLVEGLGHCSMCHTAINALGGSSKSAAFQGGLIPMQEWYAPSLTSNREAGLGNWSIKDITDLLQAGVSARGAVYGPMAEVVYNSLQYLSDADVRAMAVYLKSLPPSGTAGAQTTTEYEEKALLYPLGSKIYAAQCAMCHGANGEGKGWDFPPLAGNQSIQMTSSVNPIRMVLNGGYPPGTARNPRPYGMPPFAQSLSDEEVAAVVTFIRTAWNNHGTAITAKDISALRYAPLN
jgi:mono/diheme cytochrome c family protein